MVKFNELKVTNDGKYLIIDVSIKDLQYYTDVYLDEIIIDTQDTYVDNGPSKSPAFIYKMDDLGIISDRLSRKSDNPETKITSKSDKYYMPLKYSNKILNGTLRFHSHDGNFIDGHLADFPYIMHIGNVEIESYQYDQDIIAFDIRNIEVESPEFYITAFKDGIEIEGLHETFNEGGVLLDIEGEISGSNKPLNLKSFRIELSELDGIPNIHNNLFFVYIKTKGTPSADTPCGMDNIVTLGVTSNLYPLYQHAFNYIKDISNTCSIPKNFINFILQYKAFQLSVKIGHYVEAIKQWKRLFNDIKQPITNLNCKCYG